MSKNHHLPPTVHGLTGELGKRLGHGQDNLVYSMKLPEHLEGLVRSGEWAIKVSHRVPASEDKRNWTLDSVESAKRGTRYKKEKYEILKHFLGDYVPDSLFLIAEVEDSKHHRRPAEITLQKQLPNFRMDQLNEQQKGDPVLHMNILDLMTKLSYMYKVVGSANARVSWGAQVDTKLDLGGVSDFVSYHLDDTITLADAAKTARKSHSPNLLVDPDTLAIFCIDYDQGDWNDGMTGTKELIFELDRRSRPSAKEAIGAAAIGNQQVLF